MTAKKVRCNKRRKKMTTEQMVGKCFKPLSEIMCGKDDVYVKHFARAARRFVKMEEVAKPRKPSPAKKPEKICVVEVQASNKKWGGVDLEETQGMGEYNLERHRLRAPSNEFRLREYTAGKVLKG